MATADQPRLGEKLMRHPSGQSSRSNTPAQKVPLQNGIVVNGSIAPGSIAPGSAINGHLPKRPQNNSVNGVNHRRSPNSFKTIKPATGFNNTPTLEVSH